MIKEAKQLGMSSFLFFELNLLWLNLYTVRLVDSVFVI